MKLAFWKKQAPPPQLETLSWNFMVRATDPDECWDVAQHFRRHLAAAKAHADLLELEVGLCGHGLCSYCAETPCETK